MKRLSAGVFLLIYSLGYATTCPSISALQANNLEEWQAFSTDSGEPINSAALKHFEKMAAAFAVASYFPKAPEGGAQCYYVNQKGEYLNVLLARSDLTPDPKKPGWHETSGGYYSCQAGIAACSFIKSI